jgi:hypothetical protein
MVRLSEEKRNTIKSNILLDLYQNFPKQLFTAEISKIEARDEEFIKNLLLELKDKGVVVQIRKNEKGKSFIRRLKWQLSSKAYEAYQSKVQ